MADNVLVKRILAAWQASDERIYPGGAPAPDPLPLAEVAVETLLGDEPTFYIFDLDLHGGMGNAIGPFDTVVAAVSHATTHTAEWADWCVGAITVVHTYKYEEGADDADDD